MGVRRAAARAFGAFALLTLAACAREGPIPFLPSAVPKSAEPQPEYPVLVPPPRDAEKQPPVLTEDEQKTVEEQLKNLAGSRERAVRRRLETGQ